MAGQRDAEARAHAVMHTLARSRLELIHLSGWESIVVVTGGGLACHAPRATLSCLRGVWYPPAAQQHKRKESAWIDGLHRQGERPAGRSLWGWMRQRGDKRRMDG